MADDTEETTDAAPTNAELADRIGGIETTLGAIMDKLGGAETGAHAAAQQHTEDRLDRPSNIADEIRAQLAEKDKAAAATASAQADADWRKSVDERITGMAEHTPETPQRWIEKKMGWR